MRLRKALPVRSTAILLLVATLLCAVALRGDAGARAIGLSNAARSTFQQESLSKSTAAGRIAFQSGWEIFLINSDGTGLTQLTHSDPGVYNFQPALSPDGTQVAFGRVEGGQTGISLINVDGSELRNLTSNNTTRDSEPAWSPDGSKIAFVRGFDPTSEGVANLAQCGPMRIYVVSVDSGGNETNLTPGQIGTDPAWSPDGTRIAFASNFDESNLDGNYDIYSMTSDGRDIVQLTRTEAHEVEPAWSPDGKWIAYARDYVPMIVTCGFIHTGRNTLAAAGPDIYLMSDDGSNQTRLTETGNSIEPAWSPDGSSLAFIRISGDVAEIYVLDPNYKSAFSITSDSNYKSSPSWSRPDPQLLNGTE